MPLKARTYTFSNYYLLQTSYLHSDLNRLSVSHYSFKRKWESAVQSAKPYGKIGIDWKMENKVTGMGNEKEMIFNIVA